MMKKRTKVELKRELEIRRARRAEEFAAVQAKASSRVLSFGGGVQTTALLLRNPEDYSHVIFADTGSEDAGTYEHIEERVKPFCKEKGLEFVTVKHPELTLEEDMRERQVLPMIAHRWCTKNFKIRPVKNYIRRTLKARIRSPCIMDLGFSTDEAHRAANESNVKYIYRNYPLVFDGISREGCKEIIKEHGWEIPPKSACDFCMFRGRRHFRQMYHDDPKRFKEIMELEEHSWEKPNMKKKNKKFTLLEGISLRQMMNQGSSTLDASSEAEACEEGYCGF